MVVGTVAQWRGVWNLQDYYLGTSWPRDFVTFTVFFLIGCLIRISSNFVAAPLVVTFDYDPEMLIPQGRFKIKVKTLESH